MLAPVLLLIVLSGAAHAGEPGAMSQLQNAAQTPISGAQVFDGRALRREGDLEVLSEEKDVLIAIKDIPRHRVCEARGYGRPGYLCFTQPAQTVRTYGDIQKVRIYDRAQYKEHAALKGAAIGAGIGTAISALGLLAASALLVNPVGVVGALSVIALGAFLGAYLAMSKAANEAPVFERVVNQRSVVSERPW